MYAVLTIAGDTLQKVIVVLVYKIRLASYVGIDVYATRGRQSGWRRDARWERKLLCWWRVIKC